MPAVWFHFLTGSFIALDSEVLMKRSPGNKGAKQAEGKAGRQSGEAACPLAASLPLQRHPASGSRSALSRRARLQGPEAGKPTAPSSPETDAPLAPSPHDAIRGPWREKEKPPRSDSPPRPAAGTALRRWPPHRQARAARLVLWRPTAGTANREAAPGSTLAKPRLSSGRRALTSPFVAETKRATGLRNEPVRWGGRPSLSSCTGRTEKV